MPLQASVPTFMWSLDKPEPIVNSSEGALSNALLGVQYVQSPTALKFDANGSLQSPCACTNDATKVNPKKITALVCFLNDMVQVCLIG